MFFSLRLLLKSFYRLFRNNRKTYSKYRQSGEIKNSARYCYSVWLRHIVKAYENKFIEAIPDSIIELGPGDTLGTGIAAILSGAKKYVAFDAQPNVEIEENLKILEELIVLFSNKSDIPNHDEFPKIKPKLKDYKFPKYLFSDKTLKSYLSHERIKEIKYSIMNTKSKSSSIQYVTNSYFERNIDDFKFDMIFSQATLEHVDNLSKTYEFMSKALSSSGFMSHQIDFKSHNTSKSWDGHWKYSSIFWKLIRGNRKWFINRYPCGTHIKFIKDNGLLNLKVERHLLKPTFHKSKLSKTFNSISELDRKTSGAFIQARKKQ
ncbi:hypothetical protein CU311_06815 [Prochlorococcus marinus str. MU1402]|uniref:hypothetical protein n=1 Tax=Prochlorococcus marinus TaxID=1219 RepID=UPI001ADC24B1|nr:hypothetical protein [Prochlorococcus marinus]MBO8232390.1 hypothetical protein [Prochlorococcus marinus XMU1402]MBW3057118.1 hypothetical protein [Prochlorococcus marinus str. MU1402]